MALSSVPQTKHRFADSFNRVPQTGQSFVFDAFVSGLIIIGTSIPQAFEFMQYTNQVKHSSLFSGGINKNMTYSLYFHIPFCRKRCHYCDFYTTTGNKGLIPVYVDAVITEFRVVTDNHKYLPINTIYFGGGTPSLIPAAGYEKLLKGLDTSFHLTENCEISLEANPGNLSLDYLKQLKHLGFNRISLGVQSTDTFDLLRLDRIHTIDDVLSSISYARSAGFENVNLDLIFGLPWQDLRSWEYSLKRALQLNPEHFSIYSLIIEPGTPLNYWYQRGWIAEADQDREAEMYELTIDMLQDAGYEHYEISNWRKQSSEQDYRCRHNLQYWRNQPYFGFGASAHGYVHHKRTENIPDLIEYLDLVTNFRSGGRQFPAGPATITLITVDRLTQMRDFMLLGLRLLREGVSEDRFHRSFGKTMKEVFSEEISYLLENELVEWVEKDQQTLHLTSKGTMLANQVFMQFV